MAGAYRDCRWRYATGDISYPYHATLPALEGLGTDDNSSHFNLLSLLASMDTRTTMTLSFRAGAWTLTGTSLFTRGR